MQRARHAPLRPSEWTKRFHSAIDEDPKVLGSGELQARGAMEKVRRASLVSLVNLTDYLLYQWATTRGRWLPGMSESLTHARELRRAARRAVREAEQHQSKSRVAMFRKRERDALLRFAGVTSFHPRKGEPLEAALKRQLRRHAPTPRPMRRDFYLVCLYEAAASCRAKLTWNEIAILAQIASRAAGCERSPDERELRRYARRPGVRELARRWLTAFPPVVVALWPR